MTTKFLTGLLAKPREADSLVRRTLGEGLFQIAFGAIQWPWLLTSPIHEAGILGCSDCVQPIAV
jgi:hypothetical protein